MLNAYGSNFSNLLKKSQLLFSRGIWFLIEGIFDRKSVKSALYFYNHDELDLLDRGSSYGK
jgi:hypothetical protein